MSTMLGRVFKKQNRVDLDLYATYDARRKPGKLPIVNYPLCGF
jgi:hypothetical protein